MMNYITSANIACGFHAGDPSVMRKAVELAQTHGTAVGAHPGFPDLQGFGRRNMSCTEQEIYDFMVYQIGALQGFLQAAGLPLHHVKPHGALYNMAAGDRQLAEAVCRAVADTAPRAVLYGLAESELIRAGQDAGLQTASEVFADRTYEADLTLTPRSRPGAVILDYGVLLEQALLLVKEGKVRTAAGSIASVRADTICLHGDNELALEFARRLSEDLPKYGITIQQFQAGR